MPSRNCIVSGASCGTGKSLAEILAGSGYHVFALARPGKGFEEAITYWSASHLQITPIPADITDHGHLESAFRQISAMADSIDLLINNAGHYFIEDCEFPDIQIMRSNMEVNFLAHYDMINTFLPLLEKAGELRNPGGYYQGETTQGASPSWPIIINVTSGAGGFAQCNNRGPLAFRASKAAMNMVTRSLHHTLAPRGIAIHSVDPGWVRSENNPDGTETPENAAMFILRLLTVTPFEGGKFWYYGQPIEW